MKLKDLVEEFKTAIKTEFGKAYGEIYVNPTKDELRRIWKILPNQSFRFIATKNKKLYIFPASMLHYEVRNELDLSNDEIVTGYIFSPDGKKFTIMSMTDFHKAPVSMSKFKWLGKYFED
jgi:hypothetical protein